MRLPTLSLLLISAVLLGEMHAASAQSPTSYPWCSRGGDGDNYNICYFTSKEQCRATTSGVAAFCFANPYYRPPPPASDEAVNAPSPGWRAVQLPKEPSRQVGARQSRVVRAKPSASTGERGPGGRLDAGAAGAQVPEQKTRLIPLPDDDRPERAVNVGIDRPSVPLPNDGRPEKAANEGVDRPPKTPE
jgi:Protein of unknown function (DUF3551)